MARSEAPLPAPVALAGGAGFDDGREGVEDDAEEGDPEAAAAAAKAQALLQQQNRKRRRGQPAVASDADYGVARGVDFRGVNTVVNFDCPPDATTYTHRVGRTARGGASGVALTFVAPEGTVPAQDAVLAALLVAGGEGGSLAPLPFDPREVEGFRYRVDDVIRSVNPAAVRAARLAEVRSLSRMRGGDCLWAFCLLCSPVSPPLTPPSLCL